jgi:hypothetical protein
LDQLGNQGVIQAFEFTHELAWNLLKDYQQAGIKSVKDSKQRS